MGNPIIEETVVPGRTCPEWVMAVVEAHCRRAFGQEPGLMPSKAAVGTAVAEQGRQRMPEGARFSPWHRPFLPYPLAVGVEPRSHEASSACNRDCLDAPLTERRTQTITERARVPWDAVVFGYGAMLPFPLAILAVWLGGPALDRLVVGLVTTWGAVVLIFLAGVRRGLSFRTPGGPRLSQIAMMLWLFLAGLAALMTPMPMALILLFLGYLSLLVLDPIAAQHEQAPLYFARLRPWQMAVPVVSLLLMGLAVGE
jgi:hypothetical protein